MPRLGLVVPLSVIFLISFCSKSFSRTWHITVDGTGDAPTIQAAIDSAGMDDTLLVGPGTYSWSNQGSGNEYGMIRMMEGAPALVIVSEMGPELTILDAEYQNRIFFEQGDDLGAPARLTIDGFTFTRGLTTHPDVDIGGAFTAPLLTHHSELCVLLEHSRSGRRDLVRRPWLAADRELRVRHQRRQAGRRRLPHQHSIRDHLLPVCVH